MRSTTLTASRIYGGTNYLSARREFAQLQKSLMDQADRLKVKILWDTLLISSERVGVEVGSFAEPEVDYYTRWSAEVTAVYEESV